MKAAAGTGMVYHELVCSFVHRMLPEILKLSSVRKVFRGNRVLFYWHFNFHSTAFSQTIEMSAWVPNDGLSDIIMWENKENQNL